MKPEAQLSATIYEMLTHVWKPRGVWFAVPNGFTSKSLVHAVNMKRQGLTPGVFDWVFMWERGCGGIELKYGVRKQTVAQEDFQEWCRREHVPYEIARSVEQFQDILEQWGILSLPTALPPIYEEERA